MTDRRTLNGSCSCGRYNYVVLIPENKAQEAQVHFVTDSASRRHQGALLTAWLRIPLSWYESSTTAFFPDETHHSISRTFTPVHDSRCQRKFCGYCGTHLSYWTENPTEEQEYLNVTVGSLRGRDIEALEELDLLPEDINPAAHISDDVQPVGRTVITSAPDQETGNMIRTSRHGNTGPMTWFEEMMDGSQLGRTNRTRRGVGTSSDGSTTMQWEVSEYYEGGEELGTGGAAIGSKRKTIDDATDDTTMKD